MRILLTGGRSPAALELARLLWRAGHPVVMAESVGWHLSRGSRAIARQVVLPAPAQAPAAYVDALEALLRRERIDLLVPNGEEIFYIAAALEKLTAVCPVLCPPLESLLPMHDKGRFAELVRGHGLLAPASVRVQDRKMLEQALTQAWQEGRQVVAKPVFSRFAARVVVDPRHMADVAAVTPSPEDPWLVQDLVRGRHLCTYGLARAGRLVAHSAYATRYTLGIGASVHFVADPDPALRQWVAQLVAAEQWTGQIAFDLIADDGGQLWAIECNPRMTSGFHLLAHQPDLVAAVLGQETADIDAQGAPPAMLGTSMLLALPGALRSGLGWRAWWRDYRSARDVGADFGDPLPMVASRFLWMASVVWRARRLGLTAQQAATVDTEYNGQAFD